MEKTPKLTSKLATALQVLHQLALEFKQRKYPNVPAYGLVVPKFSDTTANDLTKCILTYIRLMGGYATRINTQGQYNEKLGKWTKGTTALGTADIHACYLGTHYSIEIKIGRDTMSEHQLATQAAVQAAGGRYFVARDFQSFYNWFNQGREGHEQR